MPSAQVWPTRRSIQHSGFRSQGRTNRNTYRTSWMVITGGAPTPVASPGPSHVVFVIDPGHVLPLEAIALWLSGHATLVSPVVLDDSAAAITKRVELPWGVHVSVRTADMLLSGDRGIVADVVTRAGEDVRRRAIQIAQAIARGAPPPRGVARRVAPSNEFVVADDDDRPAGLPSRERRMLAVIFWRRIEGKIVAGAVRDEAVARAAGIAFGGELISVDGYPNGITWVLGQRLDTHAPTDLSEIRTPIVEAATARAGRSTRWMQALDPGDKPIYRGVVIVLIDDRAVSAAEHLCLALEATSGATFIGSPTDGTNGEETYVRLPGQIEMRFTGMEIFHADGRPLQQVGIQPKITVRPTLRGLRAGKDEVLERALRYVQTGR